MEVSSDQETALVLWRRKPDEWGLSDSVEGQLFDVTTGDAIGDDFVIAAELESGHYYDPALVAIPDGGFFVAWRHWSGEGVFLEGRALGVDGSLSLIGALTDLETGSDFEDPTLSAFGDSTLILTWTDTRFPSLDVWNEAVVGVRFELSPEDDGPALLTDERVLNETAMSYQTTPHSAVLGERTLGLCFVDGFSDPEGDSDPAQVRCRVLSNGWPTD